MTMEKNEPLLHAVTRMNFIDTLLKEARHRSAHIMNSSIPSSNLLWHTEWEGA